MEKSYKNVLVALELNTRRDRLIIEKTLYIQKLFHPANIYLVHAVESVTGYGLTSYGVVDINPEIEITLLKKADPMMQKISSTLKIPKAHQVLEIGSAKNLILDTAKKFKIDLIIIGQQSHDGFNLLLGSTTNSVLHHAKCDVLTVHI